MDFGGVQEKRGSKTWWVSRAGKIYSRVLPGTNTVALRTYAYAAAATAVAAATEEMTAAVVLLRDISVRCSVWVWLCSVQHRREKHGDSL